MRDSANSQQELSRLWRDVQVCSRGSAESWGAGGALLGRREAKPAGGQCPRFPFQRRRSTPLAGSTWLGRGWGAMEPGPGRGCWRTRWRNWVYLRRTAGSSERPEQVKAVFSCGLTEQGFGGKWGQRYCQLEDAGDPGIGR